MGGIKTVFLLPVKKGGVSANPKNPYQKLLRFFLTIFDQKLSFFDNFFHEGGGGIAQSKKSLSEKTEVVRKGEGGSKFFETVKKQFF